MKKNFIQKRMNWAVLTALLSCFIFTTQIYAQDADGDGVVDSMDLDNDNDGILDTDECPVVSFNPVSSAGTFTDSGMAGDIGDMTLYPSYGTYNGMAFDLKLTVIANSNPTSLGADISGVSNSGFLFPIFLENSGNSGECATIRFEFCLAGTNTPISIPASFLWQDIDDTNPGEQIDIQAADLATYQMAQPTSLVATNNGPIIEFTSTANGTPVDQNLWLQTNFLSNSSIDIKFYKRDFDTGYLWDAGGFGTPGPVVPVNGIACSTDTDGDGIPDSLDPDSDGDGCPDAVEGGGSFTQTDLDANDMLPGGVDANGVPTTANGGQTTGASQNASDDSACPQTCTDPNLYAANCDFDGDGILNEDDLDDDNDGILDTDEGLCIGEEPVNFSAGFPNISYMTSTLTLSGNPLTVTGSINQVSGTPAGTANGTLKLGSPFDSDDYNTGDTYTLTFSEPTIVKVSNLVDQIANFDDETFPTPFISDEWLVTANGGLTLTDPNSQINVQATTANSIEFRPIGSVLAGTGTWEMTTNQPVTSITLQAAGNPASAVQVRVCISCPSQDTDGDGIPDYLDTDSDGDGCADAIEGGGSFMPTDLDANDMLTGGVDANGVPTAASGGQAVGASQDDTDATACGTDTDGDGVTDADEAADGTDPNDPCDYVAASISVIPTQAWNDADCDGDGVPNGTEVTDGTDPLDPCDYVAASISLTPTQVWNDADCDGDGVPNGTEVTDGTDPNDPCDYVAASISLTPTQVWNDADCDGDGVPNGTEVTDGTDPLDPCDFTAASITLTPGGLWNDADCDGDGVPNGTEVTDGTDPLDPCDFTAASITLTQGGLWNDADCDGDSLPNGEEVTGGSDPNDPCDPNAVGPDCICEEEITYTVNAPGCDMTGAVIELLDGNGTSLGTMPLGIEGGTGTFGIQPCGDYMMVIMGEPACYTDAGGDVGPRDITTDGIGTNNEVFEPLIADIPTVGEWGLMILGLLMSIVAVLGIRQGQEEYEIVKK